MTEYAMFLQWASSATEAANETKFCIKLD